MWRSPSRVGVWRGMGVGEYAHDNVGFNKQSFTAVASYGQVGWVSYYYMVILQLQHGLSFLRFIEGLRRGFGDPPESR